MPATKLTTNEKFRLSALEKYNILDTAADKALDDLTALAAQICDTPIAMISLLDENRQWFKSKIGINQTETPRNISFCTHIISHEDLFVITDATKDKRFATNPLVTGEPKICFYAGAPLVSPEGAAIGSLCVIDHVPRALTPTQEQSLRILSQEIIVHLEMHLRTQELMKVESNFKMLAENITDALWITSPDIEKVYFVSQGYEKIWQRTAAELYSNPHIWMETIVPEDLNEVIAIFNKINDTPSVSAEYRITRPDGTIRWIHGRGFQVRDTNSAVIRLVGIASDITDRKLAEIASSRLGAIVEYSDDAIIGKNLDSIITSWNKGAEKIFGYTADEMLGKSILRLIPPERQHEETHILEKIRHGETIEHFETQRLTKDGRLIDVSVTVSPIKDSTGKSIGASKIARDITERKQTAEKILEQAALLDKAHDAILVCNLEGIILFWYHGAERLYGWTNQEVIGTPVEKLLYTNSDQFIEIKKHLSSHGEWNSETKHITKSGTKLTVAARWTLILDNDGKPKSMLAINTDITEKKKIEAQFMRAQRMESIGVLASGIAHDLNNILTPIIMSAEILKDCYNNPDAESLLETIDISARRGADTVRQVLTFARGLEGERVEIQPKHLISDLGSIIHNTFPKNIKLHVTVPADTRTVLGDPTQLHQVLLNLCVNARDAMPNGGDIFINVKNCELDEQYVAMNPQIKPGHFVNITVTDTGTGIPQNILNKIFEPFFTTKEINKGTGLGLSTVMAIVNSHAGIINAYSEPNNGTTFKIYLPAIEKESQDTTQLSDSADLPRGQGELILVVDDETAVLTIITQTLQAFGYRVMTAQDGAAAVAIYAQHRYEIAVVITDMMMPIMDGTTTIHALHRINPATKIIATSGLSTNRDITNLAGIGVTHFLTKPYTAKTLLKTLWDTLHNTDQKSKPKKGC